MATSLSGALRTRANTLGYPFLDLSARQVLGSVLELVPERVARQHGFLPLELDGEVLRIAMSEPPEPETLDRLQHLLKHPVAVALAEDNDLSEALRRCYAATASRSDAAPAEPRMEQPIDFVEVEPAEEPAAAEEMPDPDGPEVVRIVQSILTEALRFGASRILILPTRQSAKVAYRVRDAVCSRDDLPAAMFCPVLVKLMTMANLSGILRVVAGEKERRFRVAFKPGRHGVSAVLETTPDPAIPDRWRAKAARLGYRFEALENLDIPAEVLATVPGPVARQNGILPVSVEGNLVTVVMSQVPTPEALERLRFLVNRPLAVALAPEGLVRAAVDRCYALADPETLDTSLWELGEATDAVGAGDSSAALRLAELGDTPPHGAARPLVESLRAGYREKMFEWFEEIGAYGNLCRRGAVSGDPEVALPYSHLMPQMPAGAKRYLDKKIWVLREAILTRLENYLEKDSLARSMAKTYSLYLAACHWAQGHRVSINPATGRDAWLNFVYGLAIRSFPGVDSNGALLSFLAEHLGELSAKIASLAEDPELVHDPSSVQAWLACLDRQSAPEEGLDFESPPIVHLLELLIAEAIHVRASAIAITPLEDRVEVAYRIQNAAYCRQTLPLARHYPLLARLRILADFNGELRVSVGSKMRHLRVKFEPTPSGLGAAVEIVPDVSAAEICKAHAAKHGHRFVSLDAVRVPVALLRLLSKAVAWKKAILPLEFQAGTVTVVVGSPPSPRRLDELALLFNNPVAVAMAPEDEILAAVYRHYHPVTAETAASPAALSLLDRPSPDEFLRPRA